METFVTSAPLWQQHAQRTVRRMNLAWWLELFAPWTAGLSLVVLAVVLVMRHLDWPLPGGATTAALFGLYGLTGLGCWWAGRRRFCAGPAAMVRLESHLHLNNALSAAAAGVTAWPPAPAQVEDGLRFRAAWLVAPVMLTVCSLLLAFLLPVSGKQVPAALPPPLALTRAAELLKLLEKEEVADPAALDKAREQLEALLNQPPEDYYSHHSLEAADTLETALAEAAGQLASQLKTAADAAESLEKYDSSLSPTAREQLQSEMENAIEGIKNSSLGASPELKNQLANLDPSKLKEMNPEQMKQMLDNFKAKSEACKNCQGKSGGGKSAAEQALADLLNGKDPGNGQGKGSGKDGQNGKDGMGNGGVDRGPGTGDLTFEKNASDLATNKLEQLESGDLSRSLPGDHLGTRDIEHNLDKTPPGPADGGAAAAPAGGGDAVWRDQLLPAEQKVLRRYFK